MPLTFITGCILSCGTTLKLLESMKHAKEFDYGTSLLLTSLPFCYLAEEVGSVHMSFQEPLKNYLHKMNLEVGIAFISV